MYLSVHSCFSLDNIVKGFEVAYRSFVVDLLIQKFPTEMSFASAITNLTSTYTPSTIMHTQKYADKLKQIQTDHQRHYKTIQDCQKSLETGHFDNSVPYVSDVIDYVTLFFNGYFQATGLLRNFSSVEEFQYLSKEYLLIRNSLSHPASSKILVKEAQDVVLFMRKVIAFLEPKYFWYVPNREIENQIEDFQKGVIKNPIRLHNLREIGFHQRKIVCREAELGKLHGSIVGEAGYHRVAGSVGIFGYGGVGKTALAIEFLYDLLRHLQDNPDYHPIDFILFFSSKDELLRHSETTGALYIDKIKRQISSFDEFEGRFLEYLGVTSLDQALKQYRGGIVVIDNLENLSQEDKAKIFDFIKRSPRQIQYIITSREEEPCEDKLHVKEFKEPSSGVNFIRRYVDENELEVIINDDECAKIVKASKGNTLILVLSLKSLHDMSTTVSGIVSDLEYIKARDVEVIADFMYKNTFEKSLTELESEGYSPRQVVIIMSLYGEPIDLYSVSKLAQIDVSSAEQICRFLTSKLVFDKFAEFYSINEFANNFIFIKLLPNELETNKLRIKIKEHKQRVASQRSRLEEHKARNHQVTRIMQDWKPRNYVDERAVAEAFNLYQRIKRATEQRDVLAAERIIKEFHDNEIVTSHPYIKFQKARAYEQILPLYRGEQANLTLDIISRSYEDAIQEIEFAYPYIKETESHGAILWFYGTFLSVRKRDYPRAIRYLEEAREVLLTNKTNNYFLVLNRLAENYEKMYESTRDRAYRHRLSMTVNEVKRNYRRDPKITFDLARFLRDFDIEAEAKPRD